MFSQHCLDLAFLAMAFRHLAQLQYYKLVSVQLFAEPTVCINISRFNEDQRCSVHFIQDILITFLK
jgi:hypothetical protein